MPVSLTSVSSKVMEIIMGGIEKHLKDNTVIGHRQHGFTRGKSCLSNLIFFYDKDPSGQSVQHSWIKHIMEWRGFTGSLLGPVLLNISDLDTGLDRIPSKFTDGTNLGGAVDSLKDKETLQRDLHKLEEWEIPNHMKFKKGKCRILHIGWDNAGCM
ncbi:hypothetical protein WISP_138168 [Willisornis vidua]|uniref:Rna-directed dna polymerase from mobile element jockey-like n=1 Tax=Willisornis vidua TaxID=1566151 RepID=A0ABQ9CMW1_9PASS|nr:hypothetical protein WISP_138168 [Willisornis vidua]